MKTLPSLILIAAIGLACLPLTQKAFAADASDFFPEDPDPFMGDWVGRWTSGVDVDPDIAAQVIALGGNKYRVILSARLDMRAPPKAVVDVESDGDTIAFESNSIQATIRGGQFTGSSNKGKARFTMKKVERLSPTLGKKPPADAVVLFDGTNFDAWLPPKGWEVVDGAMMVTPKGGYITSKQAFEDLEMHIEFRLPLMPKARGQQRGNSGVFIQDLYEVQVLDSYGLPGYYDECGALYKTAPPRINACAPPLQWQTFDIVYRATRHDSAGKLTAHPRITVHHNGLLIHDDQEILQIPAWTEVERLGAPPKGPGRIRMQGHGNYVQYRNIWVIPTKN